MIRYLVAFNLFMVLGLSVIVNIPVRDRIIKLESVKKANEQIIHDLNEHILNLQSTVNQLDIEQDAVLLGLNEQYIEIRNVVFEGQALDEIKDIKAE